MVKSTLVAPLALVVLSLAGCAEQARAPEAPTTAAAAGDASCALDMSFRGVRYDQAPGPAPHRSPELTGTTATAVLGGCDDGSGDPTGPEEVQVEQIRGVPLDVGFWWHDSVMLRDGATLPASLKPLSVAPVCRFPGVVQVSGQWLGVTSPQKVRFAGDFRAPETVELYVEKVADPAVDLERYTIKVHDDGTADPTLDKQMAEDALWSTRAALTVGLRCAAGKYQADSFGTVLR